MKFSFLFLVLLNTVCVVAQKTESKTVNATTTVIEINAMGLDDLVLENTDLENLEISLYSEDVAKHQIIIEENYKILNISFQVKEFHEPTTPVMKPITERLKRANAVIKIPKNKKISIYGVNNNISALDFKGTLFISIENGIVKLGNIQQKVAVKLYAGNVFASAKATNIDVTSSLGKIDVAHQLYEKKFQLHQKDFLKTLHINTIKANVFIKKTKASK